MGGGASSSSSSSDSSYAKYEVEASELLEQKERRRMRPVNTLTVDGRLELSGNSCCLLLIIIIIIIIIYFGPMCSPL